MNDGLRQDPAYTFSRVSFFKNLFFEDFSFIQRRGVQERNFDIFSQLLDGGC